MLDCRLLIVVREMKTRIMTFGLIVIIVLLVTAFYERESNSKSKPHGYSIRYGSATYIVITPLDKSSSVLVTKRGTHESVILVGIPAQIASVAAKLLAGYPDNDRNVKKLVKRTVVIRQRHLMEEKLSNKISGDHIFQFKR